MIIPTDTGRDDTYVRCHISENGVKQSLQNQLRGPECIQSFAAGEAGQLSREEHAEGQREPRHNRRKQQDERDDAAQDTADERNQRADVLER